MTIQIGERGEGMVTRKIKTNDQDIVEIRKKIEEIAEDLKKVKASPFMSEPAARELVEEIRRLASSMERLIHIFEVAQRDIIENYKGEHPAKKLERIEEQNKTIAEGLLKLSEKIEKIEKERRGVTPEDLIEMSKKKEKPILPTPTRPIDIEQSPAPSPGLQPLAKPDNTQQSLPPLGQQQINQPVQQLQQSLDNLTRQQEINQPAMQESKISKPSMLVHQEQQNKELELPDLPPLPEPLEKGKKKGLFGLFKK